MPSTSRPANAQSMIPSAPKMFENQADEKPSSLAWRTPSTALSTVEPSTPTPMRMGRNLGGERLRCRRGRERRRPLEERQHLVVERAGVLDHEPVGGAADDVELGVRDQVAQLLGVGERREDVLRPD